MCPLLSKITFTVSAAPAGLSKPVMPSHSAIRPKNIISKKSKSLFASRYRYRISPKKCLLKRAALRNGRRLHVKSMPKSGRKTRNFKERSTTRRPATNERQKKAGSKWGVAVSANPNKINGADERSEERRVGKEGRERGTE